MTILQKNIRKSATSGAPSSSPEVSFTELRSRAKFYFDAVEAGTSVRVLRNGRPIAEIVPIHGATPSWKRAITPVSLNGVALSQELIADRNDAV